MVVDVTVGEKDREEAGGLTELVSAEEISVSFVDSFSILIGSELTLGVGRGIGCVGKLTIVGVGSGKGLSTIIFCTWIFY